MRELSLSVFQIYLEVGYSASPVCLLVGQGTLIGALLCTSNFLHPRLGYLAAGLPVVVGVV